jgi:uncharacterized protein YgiM (DUF1202 family)
MMKRLVRRHPWVMRAAVTTTVVGVLGVGIVLAETVFVNVAYVDVRRDPMNVADVVGQVKQGDQVTVVERQDDWVHVKSPTVDGWVSQDQLSDKPVGPLVFAPLQGSQTSGTDTANAAKGWDEHEYAQAKSYSEDAFNKWVTQYQHVVTPQYLTGFMKAGHVGPKSIRDQAAKNPM